MTITNEGGKGTKHGPPHMTMAGRRSGGEYLEEQAVFEGKDGCLLGGGLFWSNTRKNPKIAS